MDRYDRKVRIKRLVDILTLIKVGEFTISKTARYYSAAGRSLVDEGLAEIVYENDEHLDIRLKI